MRARMFHGWWLLAWIAGSILPHTGFGADTGVNPAKWAHTIRTWGIEEGLPQSSVIAITRTRDGYLWLGTLNGLVRFDGVRFTVFDEGNTPGLNSSRIVSLFEDSQANLWVGTETTGVFLVNRGKVTKFDLGGTGRESRLVSACEDASGAVWLHTADGQLCRYQNGRANVWSMDPEPAEGYRAVLAGGSGQVWVAGPSRLSVLGPSLDLDPKELSLQRTIEFGKLEAVVAGATGLQWRLVNGRIQRWDPSRDKPDADLGAYPWIAGGVIVSAAVEDPQGHLWVGTLGDGLYQIAPDGQITHLTTSDGLSNGYILALTPDSEGNIWVGTDGGGLNRVRRPVFQTLPPSRGSVIQSVAEDGDGGLWVGANSGGVGYWKAGVWQRFLTNVPVRAVFVDRKQRVWAGTWGTAPTALQQVVLAVHQDRQGTLWFGSENGLVSWNESEWKTYTTRDGLPARVVRALADDAEGNLWIGTEGGGLCVLRDGRFRTLRKSPDGLPSDHISSLHLDADGALWIGTFGSGLARMQKDRWTRYTTRDGLASNGIGYLIEDELGFLWIGSNAGLMRVSKQALNDFAAGRVASVPCRTYSRADGLPSRECTQGSQPGACRTRDGTLWFPTIDGVASVAPRELRPNPVPPPVVIESVLVEGRPQSAQELRSPPPEAVHIPPGRERLEIHFTALNLTEPERARFKFRLEGHESAWNETGDSRIARYSKLPPGTYQFVVTACNEDGIWNPSGSRLNVTVAPPFWRTWWFLTLAATGLLGTVGGVVHYVSTQRLHRQLEQLRQQEAVEQERARIARDLHDQLGANLTQVALLGELVESDKDFPEEIEGHAHQISRTARETSRALDEIVWSANPQNDTLEGLANYVCKYAQDYLGVAGVRYRLEVPPQLPALPIPPEVRHHVFLAAKEAITNVVRHSGASVAWIRLQVDPDRFTFEIADNGRGLGGMNEEAARLRNGLRNMRRRMEDVGGSFSIGPSPDGGAAVRLTAPIAKR